jgi:hypothetical protein
MAIRKILAYWQAVTPEAGAPSQAAISPRALKPFLPDMFLVERLDKAVYAFRMAGTRLCARYGRELRDHDFVRLWPASQHSYVITALARCLQGVQPVVLSGSAATLDGAPVNYDILLMPLADPNGRVVRILGAMLTADDRALRDGAILVSQNLEVAINPLDGAATAEPVEPPALAGARETKVSFLRVVDGARAENGAAKPGLSQTQIAG